MCCICPAEENSPKNQYVHQMIREENKDARVNGVLTCAQNTPERERALCSTLQLFDEQTMAATGPTPQKESDALIESVQGIVRRKWHPGNKQHGLTANNVDIIWVRRHGITHH